MRELYNARIERERNTKLAVESKIINAVNE